MRRTNGSVYADSSANANITIITELSVFFKPEIAKKCLPTYPVKKAEGTVLRYAKRGQTGNKDSTEPD